MHGHMLRHTHQPISIPIPIPVPIEPLRNIGKRFVSFPDLQRLLMS